MVQIMMDKINAKRGRMPDKKTFKNAGDGVNSDNSLSLTNQSKDTNGADEDPILLAGKKIS